MKNYKYWLYGIAAVAMLTACDVNDKFDLEGSRDVEEKPKVAPVVTLAASDYKAIADNTTNDSIAKERGEIAALNAIATNKCFVDEAQAATYLPAYISRLYPTYTEGAKVKVVCNFMTGASAYMSDFANISTYTLGSKDYEGVWGEMLQAQFLSPKSVSEIPYILADKIENPQEGDLVAVSYVYSETEPSITTGGSEETVEPTWTEVALPRRATGSDWNFTNYGPIDLSAYKGQTVHVGFKYTSTESTCAKWELANFKALSLPYLDVYFFLQQEDGSFKKIIKTAEIVAGKYVIAALDHKGQYNLLTINSSIEEKGYGYMPVKTVDMSGNTISAADAEGCIVTLAAVEGGFTLQAPNGSYMQNGTGYKNYNVDATMKADGNYVWTAAVQKNSDAVILANATTGNTMKLYYYAKGDSYSYGCYPAESIEPSVLVADDDAFTTHDVDMDGLDYVWGYDDNYLCWVGNGRVSNVNHTTESFLVSPAIEIPEDASLPYFTIDEAFKFAAEGAADLTVWISTDYAESATAGTAVTRAASDINKTTLYVYADGDWDVYTNSEVLVSVWQPSDYAALGTSFIQKPNAVLPTYLAALYPYTVGGEKAVVVYNAGNAYAASEYQFKNGAWSAVGDKVSKSISFAKESGKWALQSNEYYANDLLGDEGGFTISIVKIDEALSYIWQNDATYGWKASGYKSGNKNTEAWVVSPVIDLSEAEAPYLTFDEAVNYLNGNDLNAYCSVAVTTEYDGSDATASSWETLDIPKRPTGSDWTYVNVGQIDLSAYAGKKVYIGFHYISDSSVATTWEFKNVVVAE